MLVLHVHVHIIHTCNRAGTTRVNTHDIQHARVYNFGHFFKNKTHATTAIRLLPPEIQTSCYARTQVYNVHGILHRGHDWL